MAAVRGTFGLYQVTVEQARADGHRPVVEKQGDVTLLVLRTAQYVQHAELTETSEVVDTGDVMVLLGDRFVVTVRHGPAGALTAVRDDLQQRPTVLAEGPWAVAYAVRNRMVDLYLEVSAHVEKDMEGLEESVFARHRGPHVQQIYQLKRELVEFKRAVLPPQAPLRSLIEERRGELPEGVHGYFVEVNARLGRAVDRVAAFDDLPNSRFRCPDQHALDGLSDRLAERGWAYAREPLRTSRPWYAAGSAPGRHGSQPGQVSRYATPEIYLDHSSRSSPRVVIVQAWWTVCARNSFRAVRSHWTVSSKPPASSVRPCGAKAIEPAM
jgi:hypothetical protein